MATTTLPTTELPLPAPFSTSHTALILVSQGAEALLYRTTFLTPSLSCALKYRPPKPYRHPTLDKRLTRSRILAEARILVRCGKEGVAVPDVLGLGAEEGWIIMGWVEGETVKALLRGMRDRSRSKGAGGADVVDGDEGAVVGDVLRKVGGAVGRLHAAGVVHGDLTSSNMILRPGGEGGGGEIVLIDFGLAQTSTTEEDRAVDLYVLERAFGSTHPELEDVFAKEVLGSYGQTYKGAKVVLKRLEDVRMRGRKKSMIG
ncbi:Kae1-associated kinase Bud32 [Sphaceloma murrayae]|uniref:EKC/KEOPS complex subunit BUD32 n=1 Tax=Sphaceloma murrayae TaxID=2082308 RepID=A0A2K1QZ82_9PEZI|nr:Kae1-associated kinase Bud32 [Sphaceloma murrayae]